MEFYFADNFGLATKGRTQSRGLFVGRKMFKLKKFSLRHFRPATQCTDLKTNSHKMLKKSTVRRPRQFSEVIHAKSSRHKIFCLQYTVCWAFDALNLFGGDMILRQRVLIPAAYFWPVSHFPHFLAPFCYLYSDTANSVLNSFSFWAQTRFLTTSNGEIHPKEIFSAPKCALV